VHGQVGGVWWANPLSPILLVVLPAVLITWAVPESVFFQQWRTPKYFGFPGMFRCVIGGVLLCIGALVATRGRLGLAAREQWPALSNVATSTLATAFRWTFRLTVLAYMLWTAIAIQRGLRLTTLVDAVQSQETFNNQLKVSFRTVTGVTTFTQLGIAASVLAAYLGMLRAPGVRRRFLILVVLSTLRGFFLAERLAIIEVVLPWVVIRSANLAATRSRSAGRALIRAAPLIAIPTLLFSFAMFEYSRSWTFARTRTDSTFAEFAAFRLVGYYATSFNNGELYRIEIDRSDKPPFDTVEFFWQAPLVSSIVTYESATGGPPRGSVLSAKANPEFNSPGGFSGPYTDYGDVGGALYFLGVGLVLGALYRSFAGSQLLGLLLYPVLFVGLLELPRYLYWAQGRATPAFVALIGVAWVIAARARRVRGRSHLAHMPSIRRTRLLTS
jgi:hypothetical protein